MKTIRRDPFDVHSRRFTPGSQCVTVFLHTFEGKDFSEKLKSNETEEDWHTSLWRFIYILTNVYMNCHGDPRPADAPFEYVLINVRNVLRICRNGYIIYSLWYRWMWSSKTCVTLGQSLMVESHFSSIHDHFIKTSNEREREGR